MVKETKDGGRVMVLGSRSVGADRGIASAKDKIADKCTKGYDIVEEGWMDAPSATGQGQVSEKYFEFKCK
jgi:hypothetical protein